MKFSVAIAVSVAVHLLIGLGIWLYMEYSPTPDVLATLDLSSVELSFADQVDDTAAVLPRAAAPEPELTPAPEKLSEPVLDTPLAPLPEIPDAVDIPKPEEKPRLPPAPTPSPDTPTTAADPAPTPPAPSPRQARVDAPPRPKRTIKPDYPKGARQRGEQGDVVVEMLVNAEGRVDEASVVTSSGFPELDEAALRAVRAARFTPAKSGRESVASSARITLTFKLK